MFWKTRCYPCEIWKVVLAAVWCFPNLSTTVWYLKSPKNQVSIRMQHLAISNRCDIKKLEIGGEYHRKNGEFVLKMPIFCDTQNQANSMVWYLQLNSCKGLSGNEKLPQQKHNSPHKHHHHGSALIQWINPIRRVGGHSKELAEGG